MSHNTPIKVFDKIFYRYGDPNYSINEMRAMLSLVRERLTALLNY